ncbi:MAG: hypothetical protein WC858_02075 [Parcubacteria group bacterium]|jgi:hypothetical protein
MSELGKKVLEKIKEEKIAPKPRWRFLLKDYFVWLLFLISLIIGAVAFCVSLHILFENDWDLYQYLHRSLAGHILISIPYIWIILLILFISVAYYNFKHTKEGYRHEAYVILGLSVIGSIILGTFLNTLGAGQEVEDVVASSIPIYESLTCCHNRTDIWDQPGNGLLGGKIIKIVDPKVFELKDFHGVLWQVREDDDTLEYEPIRIVPGEEIKVIGEKEQENVFWAREIRPWQNKGLMQKAKMRWDSDD